MFFLNGLGFGCCFIQTKNSKLLITLPVVEMTVPLKNILKMENRDELESILIGLMRSLGISKVRMMLSLALIRAHQIHEEMILWIATFQEKENTLTAQAFMSKLNELTERR